MPGTHSGEFATFEDSEEFYVGLRKAARDMLGLRTRLRDDAVTDESPKINLLCLENASVECRNPGGGVAGAAASFPRRAGVSTNLFYQLLP